MKEYDCEKFVTRADKLWSRQNFEFGGKYSVGMWLDGEFAHAHILYGAADEGYVKLLLEHILEKITLLNASSETFRKSLSAKGDKWKKMVSKDLAELPKEKVREQFNSDYIKLLSDYTRLYRQVEKLLEE